MGWQLRQIIRLEQWRFSVWIVAVGSIFAAVSYSMISLYPDRVSREQYATLNDLSPVLQAVNGPGYGLDTLGGIALFEVGAYTLVAVALMAVFGTVRLTRGSEEQGHAELTLATAIGILSPLASTMIAVTVASTILGATCAWGMVLLGFPAEGAWIYGFSVAAIGAFFTGVAALGAQLLPTGAATMAAGGVVIALSYASRAAGDLGDIGPLTASSPFGWVQYAAPFDDEQRWWPLLITGGAGLLLGVIAMLVRVQRDLGAAAWMRGPGPAVASSSIRGLLTATWRVITPVTLGWAASAVFFGAVFGVAADELGTLFEANPAFAAVIGAAESDVNEKFLGLVLQILALIATGYAVSGLQRLRTAERDGLGDVILASAVSRTRWMVSALVPSLLGSALVFMAGAIALGTTFAAVVKEPVWLESAMIAAVWQIPAIWFLTALATALLGLLPRQFFVAWAVLGAVVVISMLGPALQLNEAVANLSPFAYTPRLPQLAPTPGDWSLLLLATALVALGDVGLRTRDIG